MKSDERTDDQQELGDLLARVRRIEIAAQRLVTETLSGRYHSVFKGRGMSFEEVRPYAIGDEIRLIDWKVTARTGIPYVKRFVEERELTVVVLADASPSMDFGLSCAEYRRFHQIERVEDTKRQLAAQIAAAVALSAQFNNDRVGLVTFGSDVAQFIPPRKGRQHVLRIIREVLVMRAGGNPTNLSGALAFLGRVLKRRSAIFVISDFQCPDFEPQLRVATRRHDLHAFCVRDPYEFELPTGVMTPLFDPESGEIRWTYVSKGFVRRLREEREARWQRVRRTLARYDVPVTVFSTDKPYDVPLARHFARLRGKRL